MKMKAYLMYLVSGSCEKQDEKTCFLQHGKVLANFLGLAFFRFHPM